MPCRVTCGLIICCVALACWLPARGTLAVSADSAPYAPSFTGRSVQFGLKGFEPDFDPIYSVVISARLHDGRPATAALPDAMLVLSMYLESFQPDTTPVLPDLLRPDQTATNLVGFLQGKAALVNAAGQIAYRGSLVAEIFHDNAVHIIVRLGRAGAGVTAAPLLLRGIFTLYQGGTERGTLHAAPPLSAADRAALAVPRGRAMPWQAVVRNLSVSLPKMMGKPAKHRQTRPTTCNVGSRAVSCAQQRRLRPVSPAIHPTRDTPPMQAQSGHALGTLAVAGALALIVLAAIVGLWRMRARTVQPRGSTHEPGRQ